LVVSLSTKFAEAVLLGVLVTGVVLVNSEEPVVILMLPRLLRNVRIAFICAFDSQVSRHDDHENGQRGGPISTSTVTGTERGQYTPII